MATKSCVLLNPTAGRGAAREKLERIRDQLSGLDVAKVFQTSGPGDEKRQAFAAIDEGFETIIAIGGDGTCAGVADAILERRSQCRLCVIPAGTGNDFAKTLGLTQFDPLRICRLATQGSATRIDVGMVDGRYFLNSCGFGFDASVLEATKRVRLLKGDAVYIYSALLQLFTYRGIQVSADSILEGTAHPMLMVTVSNGRFLGGAFHIAPSASVLDGQLDGCFVGDANVLERMRVFAGAFRGTHGGLPSVRTQLIRDMTLGFVEPPMMEVDGELRQARSANIRIECVPRALNVITAPGYPL
jgi:diacylglycerol kinase (ATP)